MTLSSYDVSNLRSIIQGEGDWFTAHTIRYLHQVMFKADDENFAKLYAAFPEECIALFSHYGWTPEQVDKRITSSILRDM